MLAYSPAPTTFDTLPKSGFIRAAQLVRSKKNPGAPLPFGPATLWRKVKNQTFPAPVKLSEGVTAWRVSDVSEFMAQAQAGGVK